MSDLSKSHTGGKTRSAIGGAAGYIGGRLQGVPFGGAYAGKKLAEASSKRSESKLADMLQQTMDDAAKAP